MRNTELILYEDTELIVCHKPAGIPVQSARLGQKDMVSILNNYLAEKEEKVQVNVVHRLDQPVEGVIVFAKTKRAAAELGKQIQQGSMRKIYRAVCCDINAKPDGMTESRDALSQRKELCENTSRSYTLIDYLAKDGRTNTSSVVNKGDRDAKKAELSYSVIGVRAENDIMTAEENGTGSDKISNHIYLLTEIELETGRHHQIRVQMSHAGLPLYGDQKYNRQWQEYQIHFEDATKNQGLALCAVSLSFRHPASGKKMTFEVEPKNPVFQIFRDEKRYKVN